MRNILDETDPSGASNRERIFRHQVEVAQSWEVKIVGRDGEGETIKVASGRDSTIAAEFVLGMIGIKPIDMEKNRLALAEHLRATARDQIEIGRQLIGKEAEEWSPEQIRAFWDLCERDPARFLRAAEETLVAQESVTMDVQTEQTAIEAPGEDERAQEASEPVSLDGDGDVE
jgi:hypothetical protein